MLRFSVCRIFVADPCLFQFGLLSLHMVDPQITQDDKRMTGTMDAIREIQIFIHEIQLFIKKDGLEDVCWSEQRIAGIHLDIVSFFR